MALGSWRMRAWIASLIEDQPGPLVRITFRAGRSESEKNEAGVEEEWVRLAGGASGAQYGNTNALVAHGRGVSFSEVPAGQTTR